VGCDDVARDATAVNAHHDSASRCGRHGR
jgi:hypothetical protein